MDIKILKATPSDIPALSQLVNSAYRGESSRMGWTTEADHLDGTRTDEDGLVEMLHHPKSTILKYEESGKIIGCVYLEIQHDKLYLGMLTTTPELQGKGIGKKLLYAAEEHARENNCHFITMNVLTGRKELIDWYVRHGYHVTDEKKPFAFDHPRFGKPKFQLEFIVIEKNLVS
jgi:ribosomal protein S18 acetylase RimI-like enzyme